MKAVNVSEPKIFGFWVYLMTDLIIFAALLPAFLSYVIIRLPDRLQKTFLILIQLLLKRFFYLLAVLLVLSLR